MGQIIEGDCLALESGDRRQGGTMNAPFPYFGGKRRVAEIVWEALGDVASYVEPFAGSLAVLLGRPSWHKHGPGAGAETVNDLDRHLANFWRAVAAAPDEVARWADWPVNEADLHARHRWLMFGDGSAQWRERMHADPDCYDAKRAGWWVWGQSAWIGSGWCNERRTELSDQIPHMSSLGSGVHAQGLAGGLYDTMRTLADRTRRVRVCCGDWSRVLGPSVLFPSGRTCGVFLDPPYMADDQEGINLYGAGAATVAADVRAWALEHATDEGLRIVLCGYAGEHEMPGWREVPWKALGGMGRQRKERRAVDNSTRERLWLSPGCPDGSGTEQLRLGL